jgi:hypothetical protein
VVHATCSGLYTARKSLIANGCIIPFHSSISWYLLTPRNTLFFS